MAKISLIMKIAAAAEVLVAGLHSLQAVRPAPRLPAQVRAVPPLLPRIGAQGRVPGVVKASW